MAVEMMNQNDYNFDQNQGVSERFRLNIQLSGKSAERFSYLREEISSSSNNELIRLSLRLLDFIIQEKNKGSKFYIKNNDGDEKEIDFFL